MGGTQDVWSTSARDQVWSSSMEIKYGAHPHVIKLLEDLRTGMEAIVRVDGEAGRSVTVKAAPRHDCCGCFDIRLSHFCREGADHGGWATRDVAYTSG
eukprot:364696-Chlamydomonas_euryale.AAC.13